MSNYRILVMSFDPALVTAIEGVAAEYQCEVESRCYLELAPSETKFDLAIIHLVEPAGRGSLDISNYQDAAAANGGARLAFIFDQPNPRHELALLEAGAADVFVRPLDLNRVSRMLGKLILEARGRVPAPRPAAKSQPTPAQPIANRREVLSLNELQSHAFRHGILFRSQRMLQLMDYLRHVVGRDSNILISGETGTGKTQLAQLIHNLSPRREKPFVVANCAAITPSLLESELFGHAKGAFTGATQAHDGKFHAAQGGTLFLDEIDSLPPTGQQRLLRVLDQRVFEKVGSNESHQLNARVIAAANRPLEKLVADGQFRSDLYYRLKVVTVDLPALRERPEDIPLVAMHLVREEAEREGDPVPEITAEVLQRLAQHDWPGNIRELRNVISQMVVFAAGGTLSLNSLFGPLSSPGPISPSFSGEPPETVPAAPRGGNDMSVLAAAGDELDAALLAGGHDSQFVRPLQFERAKSEAKRILRELRQHDYNRTKTAESLGISRAALYKKLKKLNLIGFL